MLCQTECFKSAVMPQAVHSFMNSFYATAGLDCLDNLLAHRIQTVKLFNLYFV